MQAEFSHSTNHLKLQFIHWTWFLNYVNEGYIQSYKDFPDNFSVAFFIILSFQIIFHMYSHNLRNIPKFDSIYLLFLYHLLYLFRT